MRKQIRTQQVIIDMPKESDDIWIHLTLNELEKDADGNIINESPRNKFIHRSINDMITDVYTFYDPVLQKEIQISGIGVHSAIAEALCKWTLEDFGGVREGVDIWLS